MAEYNSSFSGIQHDTYTTQLQLINLIYPVGAIYLSTVNTSPALLFGGTWVQIKDTFILAAGDNYTAGDTGGSANHTHTTDTGTTGGTVLTIEQLPSHAHTFNRHSGTDDSNFSGHVANAVASNDTTPAQDAVTTSSVGSGQAHTHSQVSVNTSTALNMPPYLVVYMWKRTA